MNIKTLEKLDCDNMPLLCFTEAFQ